MHSAMQETLQLNSSFSIPAIGLGTFELLGARGERSISNALKLGYRHFDTAQMYCNEDILGRCIQPYPRSSLFITSKVGPWQHGYKATMEAANNMLKNLQTDYLDLVLLHWPGVYGLDHSDPEQVTLRHESYRALEVLQDAGKIRSIGVSNFLPLHLDKLLDECSVKPSVNQLEFHPLCHEEEVVEYCRGEGILVEAYCCLARGDKRLWKHDVLERVAQQTARTKAQVILRWARNKGVVVLPKTKSVSRMRENIRLDFELSEYQMTLLDQMHTGRRVDWNPHIITV